MKMSNIKKILALVLALVMVFALCACGESNTTAPEESKAPAEETQAPVEENTSTLVYATSTFGQKFSPFFYTTAYDEEVVGQDKKGNDDVRVVLHFHPALAPFKAAILPLSKKDVLAGPAMELYNELSKEFMVDYDETGSIGKRYRREDEIGTPYCITFDFDTVGDEANGIAADHCVTIRERDSMDQVRIPIDQVKDFLREKCAF